MSGIRLTHIGGPTVLLEVDGWRILSDPTFDPAGGTYKFGLGTSSTKTAGPAVELDDLGPIDLVLVSHDHHADNLDTRGRDALADAPVVLTTVAASKRLNAPNVRGLRAGTTTKVCADGKPTLDVLATPCRHGPPLSQPLVGQVVGFAITVDGRPRSAVWMTGDTVLTRALLKTASRLDVDVVLLHLGAVRFPITRKVRYSMTGTDARALLDRLQPRVAVPVHYEGWSHFSEPVDQLRSELAAVGGTVHWIDRGVTTEV